MRMCVYLVIAYVTLLVVVGNFVPSGPAEIQHSVWELSRSG